MHPFARYSFVLPIVGLGVGVTLIGEHLLARYYFPSVSILVAILCCSFFLGVGPGFFALFLSCFALVYLYLLPTKSLGWELLFQLLPLVTASLVMIVIIRQREIARERALQAERAIQIHVQELARTNQDLLQVNQLKDVFVSVASHELKTPITTIRGQAQLTLRRLKKQPQVSPELASVRDTFIKIDEQTRRVTELLNELLDLTSLRSGKLELARERCNLNDICVRVAEEQRLQNERIIELMPSPEPIWLQADTSRRGQVVTNLVSNALKYSPQESSVRVKIERIHGCGRISVQDEGQGISSEQQQHIFQPFYRTSDARASNVSGTGLGLAICKDIVERHHGRIWYEANPGKGSTFFVDLPCVCSEAPETA